MISFKYIIVKSFFFSKRGRIIGMKKRNVSLFFSLIIAGILFLCNENFAPIKQSVSSPLSPKTTQKTSLVISGESYPIVRVVDGDTIIALINGAQEKVRLIGLNTPETVDPRKPVECFGKEASDEAKKILTGKSVRLETDPSQSIRDKYDRLLAYVFLPDGTNFDEMMIENGYGYEYTYDTPYKYQTEFKNAEKEARENKRGLWADGMCNKNF